MLCPCSIRAARRLRGSSRAVWRGAPAISLPRLRGTAGGSLHYGKREWRGLVKPRSGSASASPGHSLPLDGLCNAVGEASFGPNEADPQRLEEVIADCTESIRLNPRNSGLYLERSEARTSLDRYEEALADYDRAIQFDPDNAAAYLGRCHAKSELGRHEEAISDYDQALHLDPDAASAFRDP